MIILHLLPDLGSIFQKHFLKLLDKYHSLTESAYRTLLIFIKKIETEFNSALLDTFLNSIHKDVNGCIIAQIRISTNQSKDTITLNYTHCSVRNQTLS